MTPDDFQLSALGDRIAKHALLMDSDHRADDMKEHDLFVIFKSANLMWPRIKALADENPRLAHQAKLEVQQIQSIARMAEGNAT